MSERAIGIYKVLPINWPGLASEVIAVITGNMYERCEDKNIRVFLSQKPWMNSQVHTLLRTRDAVFRSGNRALYNTARADLKRGIKKAKSGLQEEDRVPSLQQ